MEEKKNLWRTQRVEREKLRKECQQQLQSLKEQTTRKEFEIEIESQNQIQSELQLSQTDFSIKLRQEMDLFRAKDKETKDKFRTQELLETTKLMDDFGKRIERLSLDQMNKIKDIEEKTKIRLKNDLKTIKDNYSKQFESVVEGMNRQIIDLDEKLMARERDLFDDKSNTQSQVVQRRAQDESHGSGVKRPIDLIPLEQKKTGNDDKQKATKEDKSKKTKPWTDMKKFDG